MTDTATEQQPQQKKPSAPNTKGKIETPTFDDSRSETSTVDTDPQEAGNDSNCPSPSDLSHLTFFTRLYEIPLVNDAVSNIYRIAESNRYTSSILSYAEKVGGFAERSSQPLLKPVEKPIVAIDGYATRSLELIESKYPIVGKPTNEVFESVQDQAKQVSDRYPVVARTFAVTKSTANSTLDRVDYLIDYVLPQPRKNTTDDQSQEGDEEEKVDPTTSQVETPLGKVTILVHKVPHRLGQYYYEQLVASKNTIGNIKQSVKDTVVVYESEIGERSSRLLSTVQERVKSTVNTTIPSYLPQFAQPYYEHSKDVLVTKAAKLHAEYSRTDEDTRSKVFNLILISGEQVPVLERITSRIFGKATANNEDEASKPSSDKAKAE